ASIETDPIIKDALIDYLVGVMGASVEQSVDTHESTLCLNVYLKEKNPDITKQQQLQDKLEAHLKELATIFQAKEANISWEQIEDQDWSSNWKIHFKPFTITEGLVIVPTWEEYTAKNNEQVIVMDPGMAFGTGHHATTSLSLEFIRKILTADKNQRVLDVGTGTAILGMSAALFGASRVLGIDNDPEAVRIATENVKLNRLNSVMEVSPDPLQQIDEQFDLIVANIIHDVLITMADAFNTLLTQGGNLILSGILHGEQERNIIRVFTDCGFLFVEKKQQEEWASLHFTIP
ncbi:MAG TPA: 50S ribosomal protein L11 methyltransferase, partial [Desulfocapsa sulfexigens]|nr:50S ribosomal protein L11 methyltransferase [Desulfocapsa sulfexigens]